jgi:hypothetical protein
MVIKPSLRFALLLLFLHMTAATIIYATVLPAVARTAIILLIALSLIYYLGRDVFLVFPDSWHEISLDKGDISVAARDGSSLLAQVANTTIVSPFCILLRIRMEGHHLLISRAIFSDSLGEGEFRELYIHLRFS